MLILAHRGYHASVPENTLEAFAQTLDLGADGIETDIRLSADGLPILFHDRSTSDGRSVAGLSRAQLSERVGYAVPTLEEALEEFDDVTWDLEIKTVAAAAPVLSILSRRPSVERLLVTSFWHPVLERFARELGVDCGLVIAHRPLDQNLPLSLPLGQDNFKTLVWDFETLDPLLIQRLAAADVRHYVYGVQTLAEHKALAAYGVDGVITDHPEFLIQRQGEG
jgi:glycerophosphoryl diester phosphodiesterase